MSEEVLEGLSGVELVNSDYQDFREINIVWYDSAVINIEQMENVLKDAGLYLGTLK